MFERFRIAILFAVGLSIPIQGLAVGSGALVATPFKLLTVVLVILAGMEFGMRSGGRPTDRKTIWVLAFAMSFAVASAMSAVGGVPWRVILGPGSTMAALTAYYYLLSYAARTRTHLIAILWGVVLGGAVTLAPGVRLVGSGLAGANEGRFQGLAGQSNVLGADMNVCFAIAVCMFFTVRSNFLRMLAVGSGTIALAGVAISLSRAAFLGLGSMGIYWLVRSGRKDTIKFVVPAIFLAMIAVVAAPQAVVERAGTIFDAKEREADSSIQARYDVYVIGVKAFASNPLLGVGAERFRPWARSQGLPHTHTIHNGYLYIAAEQGILGLAPFMALLILTWRDYTRTWRMARANRMLRDPPLHEIGQIALYLQLALLSLAIGAAFHQTHKSKALWTVMAISPLVIGLARQRVAELRSGRPEAGTEPEDTLFPAFDEDAFGRQPLQR